MYRCDNCDGIHPAKEKKLTIVSQIRTRKYKIKNKRGIVVRETEGWEIIKEHKFCKHCYEENKDESPSVIRLETVRKGFGSKLFDRETPIR